MTTIEIHAPSLDAVWQQLHGAPFINDNDIRGLVLHFSIFLVLLVPIGLAMLSLMVPSVNQNMGVYVAESDTTHLAEPSLNCCVAVLILSLAMTFLSLLSPTLNLEHIVFFGGNGLVLACILHHTLHLQLSTPVYSALMATTLGIVHPVIAVAAWSSDGWFNQKFQIIDIAGSGVIHITIGTVIFITLCVLPDPLQTSSSTYNKPQDLTASILLALGWPGILLGRISFLPSVNFSFLLASCLVQSILAASGGFAIGFVARAFGFIPGNAHVLAGFVALSGCIGLVEHHVALFIGMLGALVYLLIAKIIVSMQRLRIPSAYSEAVSVHLGCGLLATILSGFCTSSAQCRVLFGTLEYYDVCSSSMTRFGNNVVYAVVAFAWAGGVTASILLPVRRYYDRLETTQAITFMEMDNFPYDSFHQHRSRPASPRSDKSLEMPILSTSF